MFSVVLGCAGSFWLFYVDFCSIGKLGCLRLFRAVLGLLKFALSHVLLFEVPSDLQVGSSCSRLLKFVFFNCFRLFFSVSGCFQLFAFVSARSNCFGCSGDSTLFCVV